MIKQSIIIIAFILIFPFSASCQRWQGLGTGLSDPARCFFTDTTTNTLYVGGGFVTSGGITTWGIATWNGLVWDSVGPSALGMTYCWPISAIIKYKGELYAGGGSTGPIGTRGGIEKWNGINWELVGGGINGGVCDLYIYNNELYICGIFDSIGNIAANGLAKWDGNTWSDVHSFPNYDSPNLNFIYSMAIYNGELYVAGSINHAMKSIVKWDGTSWQIVGGGFDSGFAAVASLVVYKNKLYAAGSFSKADSPNTPGNYIAAWDGNSWSDVGGGVLGVSGYTGQISNMIIKDDNLYVVGMFSYAGGVPAKYIAKWDGTNWCGLGSVFDNGVGCLGVYQDMLYIGGGFIKLDGDTLNRIAKWTGGSYVDTCGNSTGLHEFNNNANVFAIYPNPAVDKITIENISITKNQTISIYDIQGQLLLQQQMQEAKTIINIVTFAKGLYFLKVENENGIAVKKFVKE